MSSFLYFLWQHVLVLTMVLDIASVKEYPFSHVLGICMGVLLREC